MPRLDKCHPAVVRALLKAGWQIISQSLRYLHNRRIIYIDIVAQKDDTIIHIEVKCFEDPDSRPDDEYQAVGQYTMYQLFFEQAGIDTMLYLAIPNKIYTQADDVFLRALEVNRVKPLLFDEEAEEIMRWIESY